VSHAPPEYPETLQNATDTPSLPHCSVRHRDHKAGSDTDERALGDDPNYAGDGDLCGPKVGCSASRRGAFGSEAWGALLGVLSTLAVARPNRRRSRGEKSVLQSTSRSLPD
jgi:hypothetical protein